MEKTEKPTRVFDIVDQMEIPRRRPAFRYRANETSLSDYIRLSNRIGLALLHHGLKRGEAVAILSDNRPEWNFIDMGVMQAGGILLPLCKGLSAEEYVECLQHANIRTLILEDEEILSRFKLILPQIKTIESVFSIDPCKGIPSIADLIAESDGTDCDLLARRRNLITSDDVCTLIYSGGGTYSQLTHKMLLEEIVAMAEQQASNRKFATGNNALCTRYGRAKCYANQMLGRTISYPTPNDDTLYIVPRDTDRQRFTDRLRALLWQRVAF